MTETHAPPPPVYREATVMWRMGRADGQSCHAVIARRFDGLLVFMWYINGHPLGFREFRDWTTALDWSDRLQLASFATMWAFGDV